MMRRIEWGVLSLVAAIAVPLGARAQTPDDLAPGSERSGPLSPLLLEVTAGRDHAARAPIAWAQPDPGDSIYRQARQALNRSEFEEAAVLFANLRSEFPESEYVADSYYYQAFSLYRLGSRARLRQARELLREQVEGHPEAPTRNEADGLLVRIEGELARTGDSSAFQSVTDQATQACDESEQSLKSMALSALMSMDADRAVPILRDVLQDRGECSEDLRAQAVFILSQKMTDDIVPLIIDLAVGNPDPSSEVREAAVFALAQVPGPEAEEALARLLTTADDQDLQEQALMALAQRSSDRARELLRSYALDESVDPDLRETAIFWVGQQRGAETFDFLEQIFRGTEHPDVKEAVVFSMTQTGDPRLGDWLLSVVRDSSQSMDARENALFWYGQNKERANVAGLLALFEEVAESELKEAVLFGLSQRSGDDEALEALITIARTEEDPEIVENALFWLGQSDDPRATEVLLEIIRR